jgi:hypothetical protein
MRLIDKAFLDLEKEIIAIREKARALGQSLEETIIYSGLISRPATNRELYRILDQFLALSKQYNQTVNQYLQLAETEKNKSPEDLNKLRVVQDAASLTEKNFLHYIEIILDFMHIEIRVEE